jgi:hypothetical protein
LAEGEFPLVQVEVIGRGVGDLSEDGEQGFFSDCQMSWLEAKRGPQAGRLSEKSLKNLGMSQYPPGGCVTF